MRMKMAGGLASFAERAALVARGQGLDEANQALYDGFAAQLRRFLSAAKPASRSLWFGPTNASQVVRGSGRRCGG